jgi:hypothetical protein
VSRVPLSSARRARLEGSRRRAESQPLPPRRSAAAAADEESDASDETRGRRAGPLQIDLYIKLSSLNSKRRTLHPDRRPADSNRINLDSSRRHLHLKQP